MDGDYSADDDDTFYGSNVGTAKGAGEWGSVRVADGSTIRGLVYYNNYKRTTNLGTMQFWLGNSAGEQAKLCGEVTDTSSVGPYVVLCGDATGYEWVTAVLTSQSKIFKAAELFVFGPDAP